MKFGSFLLGGLVGAAAVVYLNNKSKSMLFSAFTNSTQTLGGSTNKSRSNDRQVDSSSENKNKMNRTAVSSFKKDASAPFSSPTLGKVEEIISQDPELKSTVNEILAENDQKEVYQTQ